MVSRRRLITTFIPKQQRTVIRTLYITPLYIASIISLAIISTTQDLNKEPNMYLHSIASHYMRIDAKLHINKPKTPKLSHLFIKTCYESPTLPIDPGPLIHQRDVPNTTHYNRIVTTVRHISQYDNM